MEFGIFAQVFVPKFESDRDPMSEHRRLVDNLEMAVAAESHGYKYVWTPEHHFLEEYSHASAPEVFLSFVASRTQNIHVGAAIFNITPPVNHPVRTAERVATLDQLSNGRAEFGTGRGSSSTEYKGFGIPDGEITRDMFDEVLPEILRMWREDRYSFDGRFFSVPERNVLPKPLQAPHPPLWVAAGNAPTFEKAARLGIGLHCFSTGPVAGMAKKVDTYKTTIAEAEPVGAYVNDNVMCVTPLLCLEDRRQAFELSTRVGMAYYQSLVFRWLDTFAHPPGLPKWPDLLPELTIEQVEKAAENGTLCVGDPDDCTKVVQKYADIGIDQICFSPLTTTMPTETALQSLELFGKEVISRFDRDPLHSTTRYRLAAGPDSALAS
ncbi:MAG TPA: LLM class flavin-dependent oxidoreductase [Acidimicrobiales bacterium]|nr:LLM class flavin-dependent oxidoreductase [Acidimicrobiales bacterium]